MDVSEGLSQNTITDIEQDKDGFLWVGTRYGLNKYDGFKYSSYLNNKNEQNSLSHNLITSLHYDETRNILWIGTYGGGLNYFDIEKEKFGFLSTENSDISDNYIIDLEISQNLLWIGTEKGGLNLYDLNKGAFTNSFKKLQVNQLNASYITAIEDNSKYIAIGTWQDGLYLINSITGELFQSNLNNVPIRSLALDKKNEFKVGTNEGVFNINVKNRSIEFDKFCEAEVGNSVILALLIDKRNNTYIGTENDGLFVKQQDGQLKEYHTRFDLGNQEISGNSIWSIMEDRFGTLWIGYYLKGLNKIDAKVNKFESIRRIATSKKTVNLDLVSALHADDKFIWIGTEVQGLYKYDPRNHKTTSTIVNNKTITALMDDPDGIHLWIGTWNEGVIILNKKTNETRNFLEDEVLSSNFIHDIKVDRKGLVWVACFGGGIEVFKNGEHVKSISKEMLVSTKIRSMAVACDDAIIIGTEENGIQRIELNDKLEIIDLGKNENIKRQTETLLTINGILVDEDCNIWLGGANGLMMIDADFNQQFTYGIENGLPSNWIASLEKNGNDLWGSTNRGLFKFNVNSKEVESFDEGDGLLSNEFLNSSSSKGKDGVLFFGNTNGLNIVKPNKLVYNNEAPKVFITNVSTRFVEANEIKIKQHKTNSENILELPYTQNDVSIEFTALNFTRSADNLFRYRLIGFDDDWQVETYARDVLYRDLAPGSYTFELLGSNNDGVWNKTPASFKFKVLRAWYNSYLAWFLYLAFGISMLYYFIRSRIVKSRLETKMKIDQIEIENLKEIDNLKSQFFTNISHELLTPLTLIMAPVKAYANDRKNKIDTEDAGMILKNAIRLRKFIKQMLALAKMESGHISLNLRRYNLELFLAEMIDDFKVLAEERYQNLEFKSNLSKPIIIMDGEKMEQVFTNIITNAIKYSNEKSEIIIDLQETPESLVIKISDNGDGIPSDKLPHIFERYYRATDENNISGSGIGLSISQEIVKLHDGEISVESQSPIGTCFTIALKKGNTHFSALVDDSLSDDKGFEEDFLEDISIVNVNRPFILIVDDNPDIRTYLRKLLKEDYNIITAPDGVVATELAIKHIPDIIITDWMMPNKNGMELCRDIKQNPITSHIAIIMLTVKDSDKSHFDAYEVGADYYISKPFNPKLITIRVSNILKFKNKQIENLKNLKSTEPDTAEINAHLNEFDREFIDNLEAVMMENIGNSDFQVVDLCIATGYSKSQLYRKLTAIVGMTANEYLRNIRIQHAAKLIQEGNYRISEVTYMVGFNDLQYFRKCFKDKYGVPPSKFNPVK